MRYHQNDKFSTEEHEVEEEETTKNIVIIKLKSFKNGVDRSLLDSLLDEAIKNSKHYTIFNCHEGLLVEKDVIK